MSSRDEKRRQKQRAKKVAKRKTQLAQRRRESRARKSAPVHILSYEVTNEPLPELGYDRLPEPVKDELERLHDEVLLQKPEDAVTVLKTLIERYPDVPQIYNYLHVAYQQLNDRNNAQRILQETLARFPDYLFARIAYANACLQRGEAEKVPAIFNNEYDLQRLYPERTRFHVTEVLSFCATMAQYFHTLGDFERAEMYYKLMDQLDPEHPNTRLIKQRLYPSQLGTLLRRLATREP